MKPDKNDRRMGPLLGILLLFIWFTVLFYISERCPYQCHIYGPLFSWASLGPILLFLQAGNHLMYYRKLGGIEAVRSMNSLESCLLGFVIWLIVTGLFFMDTGTSYLNTLGGYLTILAILLIWDWNTKRKYLQTETGEGDYSA